MEIKSTTHYETYKHIATYYLLLPALLSVFVAIHTIVVLLLVCSSSSTAASTICILSPSVPLLCYCLFQLQYCCICHLTLAPPLWIFYWLTSTPSSTRNLSNIGRFGCKMGMSLAIATLHHAHNYNSMPPKTPPLCYPQPHLYVTCNHTSRYHHPNLKFGSTGTIACSTNQPNNSKWFWPTAKWEVFRLIVFKPNEWSVSLNLNVIMWNACCMSVLVLYTCRSCQFPVGAPFWLPSTSTVSQWILSC